ncbi:MAG: molybdopterin-dependent oxidoreductase [Deltaproteobacteria bacterium]|nr:molybdopterin-dependent oxidoreductase [Deltaproteobacteria bacterium]
MKKYRHIGKRLPRVDARDKVRGTALFTDDIAMPGILCGMILRSPLPHAKIIHIDTSRAMALPGVRAVVTGEDTPKIPYGVISRAEKFMDEYPLAVGKVRFIGDEVAAVAAVDPDIALEALDLIEVEYEELQAVFDPGEAQRPDAPQLHAHAPGNISREFHMEKGDIEKGFEDSDLIREDTFNTQSVIHAYLEPQAVLARWDMNGRLTLYSKTQTPYYVQQHLARTLGMPPERIRVIKPYMGGGFGANSDGMHAPEFCAALLSRRAGQPVKVVCSRDEEFIAARRRHPVMMTMKTGVKKDGTIMARYCKAILDGGAYCSLGPLTTVLVGTFQTLPYAFENYQYDGYRIYTNKPPCGAMRGHGGPQCHFAQDAQMDMIAEDLGMGLEEIALKNGLRTGDESAAGFRIISSGCHECVEKVVEHSGLKEKRQSGKGSGHKAYGIGMGCGGYPSGAGFYFNRTTSAHSSVIIKADEYGGISVLTGASDIGQGSDTVITQVVAEVLGLSLEDIHLTTADTMLTPPDMGTYSSRVTVAAGNAALRAAEAAKRELFKVVSEKLEANPDDLVAGDHEIFVKGSPDQSVSFIDAVNLYQKQNDGSPLVVGGSYNSPDSMSPTYSFGAYVAEVEVDLRTGEVMVLSMTVGHDCGQPLNPMSVEGQIEGCIQMGVGYALSENLFFDGGQTLNPSLMAYKPILANQMPRVDIHHVVLEDPEGPFGAKETGEGSTDPTAPAIVNAVCNATGLRFYDLPITPEKILKGLKQKGNGLWKRDF